MFRGGLSKLSGVFQGQFWKVSGYGLIRFADNRVKVFNYLSDSSGVSRYVDSSWDMVRCRRGHIRLPV